MRTIHDMVTLHNGVKMPQFGLGVYKVEEARAFLADAGIDVDRIAPQIDGKVASAFVRARKPEAKACCGPACCS